MIAEYSLDVAADADAATFLINDISVGPCMLKTWAYDRSGKELAGAYYAYVNQIIN